MTGVKLAMSYQAIGWVLRDAPGVQAQWVGVLMGLAEHADKHGRGSYPSAATLAEYARKSERQVRYDLEHLTDARLIRPGDQSLAAQLPVNRRPVVYDLAMERTQALEVQPTAPLAEVQPTAPLSVHGMQPTAPQRAMQPTAPQNAGDQAQHDGVQPTAPLDGTVLGCNGAQPGVQPTADKPYINQIPMAEVREGGSGGEVSQRPKRDLNEGRDDVMELCSHLADRVEVNTGERPKITKGWLDAARLMLDSDHRRADQIRRAIDWCQDSEFWRKNVRSMPKLREQYVRLRMEAEDERKRNANGHASGAPGPDRARGWMEAARVHSEATKRAGRELPRG
jgi:Helix-turn-helix domain